LKRKPVNVQSEEERLAEVDRVILETCSRGCELIKLGAPVSEVDVTVDFLRALYRRRDIILVELNRAGVTEKDAYAHLRANHKEAMLI
jgi:hypothetical protein